MKNLFERLKPEIKEALISYIPGMPGSSVEDTVKALQDNYVVIALRYDTIVTLKNACKQKDVAFNTDFAWDAFEDI